MESDLKHSSSELKMMSVQEEYLVNKRHVFKDAFKNKN